MVSVLSRCLEKYWGAKVFDLGTEDGSSVLSKLCSTLTTVAFLRTILNLGVCGFDDFTTFMVVRWLDEFLRNLGVPIFLQKWRV